MTECVSLCFDRGCFLTSSLIGTLALSLTIPLSIMTDICMQKVSGVLERCKNVLETVLLDLFKIRAHCIMHSGLFCG